MIDSNRIKVTLTHTLAALLLVWGGGCAGRPATKAPSGAIFYPPPPDAPRLQFLTTFSDAGPWVERSGSFAQFVTGAQSEDEKRIRNPYGLAVHDGKLYICDVGAHVVHIVDFNARSYRVLGDRDQLRNPVNITIAPDGTKYICDTRKRVVVVFNRDDQYVRDIGDPNTTIPGDAEIIGDELIVAEMMSGEVQAWSMSGEMRRVVATRGPGPHQLRRPTNLAVTEDGHVLVADTESSIVKEYTVEGEYLRDIGRAGDRPGDFARPKGMTVDQAGRIYIADAQWEVVQVFDPSGQLLVYFGGGGPDPQDMGMPAGLTTDTSSIEAFRQYVAPGFNVRYLLFVANQFGKNKIGVYAFGEM